MLQYEIAGIKLCIDHTLCSDFSKLRNFESSFNEKPDMYIKFIVSGFFAVRNFRIPKNDDAAWFSEVSDQEAAIYLYQKPAKRIEYKVTSDMSWTDVKIEYLKKTKNIEETFFSILGNCIMSNKVLFHSGIVLHASSISYQGKGIAFTAPSGTGKSTHTEMWEKYYNASVLNDDCPIIRVENDQTKIYGSPWNGSNNKSINSSAPLTAIVILERSENNSIRELSNKEAIPLLLPRVFLPYRNTELMDYALQNTERIIQNTPKFLLRCRPDREAVDLVHQCII
jgi:hypothetical protein